MEFKGFCWDFTDPRANRGVTSADLNSIIHGVAEVARLDGDEVGYLVAKVAEIKWQR